VKPETVRIQDTTLRDGLRNSGVAMTLDEKLRVAQWLQDIGVAVIEAGFGGPGEVDSMRQIARSLDGPMVIGISRVNLKDVRRVIAGVELAKHPGINIFAPTSDAFMDKAAAGREQILDAAVAAIRYAKQHLDYVEFSAQDATRSDHEFLATAFSAAAEAGASVLSVADTVGRALPREFGALFDHLHATVSHAENVTWSAHCHNDLGLAVANSLAAIENGARQIECTVDGIGERCGNTPMQLVVRALYQRSDAFPSVRTTVSREQLPTGRDLLAGVISGAVRAD
jgi:2-isopropylmalate synthase